MDVPAFVTTFPEYIVMHLNTEAKTELYVKDFVVATESPVQ